MGVTHRSSCLLVWCQVHRQSSPVLNQSNSPVLVEGREDYTRTAGLIFCCLWIYIRVLVNVFYGTKISRVETENVPLLKVTLIDFRRKKR